MGMPVPLVMNHGTRHTSTVSARTKDFATEIPVNASAFRASAEALVIEVSLSI